MGQDKYELLKALPIGTNFKDIPDERLKGAWEAVKGAEDKPFGPMTAAAYMRIKEARLAEKTLKRLLRNATLTPDMADHLRALPVDDVFAVNQFLCGAIAEHIEGTGANAFLSHEGFNRALKTYELPLMEGQQPS